MESEDLLYKHIEQEKENKKYRLRSALRRGKYKTNYVKKCWFCGKEVIWQNDFMQSELGMVCDGDSSDKIVSMYECPHCDKSYMVIG